MAGLVVVDLNQLTEGMCPVPLPLLSHVIVNPRLQGKVWNDVVMLEETMPRIFSGLARDMSNSHGKWAHISTSATPYNEDLPGAWNLKLTNFQKLLILRVLRPEKLVFGTRK